GGAGDLSRLHADGPLSGELRDVQSARVPRAACGRVPVREATLRLAHRELPHLAPRAHRAAVLAAEPDGAGCELVRPGRPVRLRQLALVERDGLARSAAAAAAGADAGRPRLSVLLSDRTRAGRLIDPPATRGDPRSSTTHVQRTGSVRFLRLTHGRPASTRSTR